tara:strand:+ start:15630 stop:16064 length:435 start_codon:yes stop_codon:yes gene_type:complete
MQRVHFIDSYISAIDFKAKDSNDLNVDQLKIKGDKRIIATNESEKNIVLKNKAIVRVKYKNHLYNNFIKSKIFYYNKNELVCIKIQEILPNQLNKGTLYKRTIYLQNNKPIADSDISNLTIPSSDLVNLGLQQLKNEYLSLNEG